MLSRDEVILMFSPDFIIAGMIFITGFKTGWDKTIKFFILISFKLNAYNNLII